MSAWYTLPIARFPNFQGEELSKDHTDKFMFNLSASGCAVVNLAWTVHAASSCSTCLRKCYRDCTAFCPIPKTTCHVKARPITWLSSLRVLPLVMFERTTAATRCSSRLYVQLVHTHQHTAAKYTCLCLLRHSNRAYKKSA